MQHDAFMKSFSLYRRMQVVVRLGIIKLVAARPTWKQTLRVCRHYLVSSARGHYPIYSFNVLFEANG